jgi:hypothetical protein
MDFYLFVIIIFINLIFGNEVLNSIVLLNINHIRSRLNEEQYCFSIVFVDLYYFDWYFVDYDVDEY